MDSFLCIYHTWWRSVRVAVSLQRDHACCVLTSQPIQNRKNDLIFPWELFHMFTQNREASKPNQNKTKNQPASSALPAANGAALPVGGLSPQSQLDSTKRWVLRGLQQPLLARSCSCRATNLTLARHLATFQTISKASKHFLKS